MNETKMNEAEIYMIKETYLALCEFMEKRMNFVSPSIDEIKQDLPKLVIIPLKE